MADQHPTDPPVPAQPILAEVQWVSIPVIVLRGKCYIASRGGKRRHRKILLSDIQRMPSAEDLVRIQWRQWLARMKGYLSVVEQRERKYARDPWAKKIFTWYHSFRLRKLDLGRPRVRPPLRSGYPTHTWDEAVKRLRQQAYNFNRWYVRSAWEKWAHSVANNSNKRKGGRYARTKEPEPDQGQGHPCDTQGTSVQMCFDWADPDARDGDDGSPDTAGAGRVA